ncbi:MAG: hypothetical protein AAFQ58_16370 [Pseudomonadota bacterium]
MAGAAVAQSAYACRGLDRHAGLPAVEGAGGMFFAIQPELQAHHALADGTIAQLAALSEALATRGTTLVLMPVPTRAQVMTEALPTMAAHLGYEVDLAAAVHENKMHRLTAAGLTVADALPSLRAAARAGLEPMLQTDPRPTAEGVQHLAKAVGVVLQDHHGMDGAVRARFTSTPTQEVTLPSPMRVQLQQACQSELPQTTVMAHQTVQVGQNLLPASTGPVAAADRLVVLGSDLTATPPLNLPGFLSEATGLAAQGYGVPGGGAFAAMSSYLTSDDFAAAPPRILVWEWPVTASMGRHGAQPMAELIAAAHGRCTQALALRQVGDQLLADLRAVPQRADVMLAFDLGGRAAQYARFHLTGADGLTRTRSIYRHQDQILTGRFFLSLADMAPAGLSQVAIETDSAPGLQPRLSICF